MRERSEQNVVELCGVFLESCHDGRMAMAMQVDPPGGDAVNETAAIFCIQVDAFGSCDTNRRRVQRLLGEGMPDLQAGTHVLKASRSKCLRKTSSSAPRSTVLRTGIVRTTGTRP